MTLLSGCHSAEPAIGDSVQVQLPRADWSWERCGAVFPQLVEVPPGAGQARYAVYCPALGKVIPVPRVRVPTRIERVLVRLALGLRILVWITVAIAVLGLFVTDPFGLRRTRAEVAAWREQLGSREGGGDGLPSMTPLECENCGAPVPLHDSQKVICPRCGNQVTVPEDYREPARLRRRAMVAHERAARLWRVYHRLTSRPVRLAVALFRWAWLPVTLPAFFYGLIIGVLTGGYAVFAMLFVLLGLWPWAARKLPSLGGFPDALETHLGALSLPRDDSESTPCCRTCGAPIDIPSLAQSIATCGYCGTDHLLLSRVRRERAVAGAQAERAAISLVDATASLEQAVSRLWRVTYGIPLIIVVAGVILAAMTVG